jgi:hypothetical protein
MSESKIDDLKAELAAVNAKLTGKFVAKVGDCGFREETLFVWDEASIGWGEWRVDAVKGNT